MLNGLLLKMIPYHPLHLLLSLLPTLSIITMILKKRSPLIILCLTLLSKLSSAIQLNRAEFTAIVGLNRIYTIGGTTVTLDTAAFDYSSGINIDSIQWRESIAPLNPQLKAYEYGVAYKGADDIVFIQAGKGATTQMEDIVTYNLTSGAYEPGARTSELKAQAMYRMSATVNPVSNIAYYYGGVGLTDHTQNGIFYNTFASFDTTTRVWKELQPAFPGAGRPARASHRANIVNNQLFILGGVTYGGNASEPTKETKAGLDSVLLYEINENTAAAIATLGDAPSTRLGFSTTEGVDGHSIVLFGGHVDMTTSSVTLADTGVYVLDTCTLTWSKKEVKGTGPPPLYGHSASTINNYMVIMMGKTDLHVFSQKIYVLDMVNWKWISRVGTNNIHSTIASPSCRFMLPDYNAAGKLPTAYDYSVIDNPYRVAAPVDEDKKKKEGLGIGFGVFAFLLLLGVGVFIYMRRQRKKSRTLNPRWMRHPSSNQPGNPSNTSDYPLFVYNKEVDINNPNNPNYRNTAFAPNNIKTYTSSEQEQWEHQLNEEADNPWHGQSHDRHSEVWKRMRGLNDAAVISDEEVRNHVRH
ncbi:hypothetical protein BDB01DRAFT_800068 [Pilobolus umbonatus]|nr:hypothetical protein BDB01DRAFT_800068 [Pilobolus umbonatus]